MLVEVLSLRAGFVLLFVGGEGLVRGAVSIATRFGLSTMLVGVVIVGFGTSMPELLVSLEAAFKNTPDIALGNVVGSNIANIILILGVAAVIHPVACNDSTIKRDALAVIVASHLLGEIERVCDFLVAIDAGKLIHAAPLHEFTEPRAHSRCVAINFFEVMASKPGRRREQHTAAVERFSELRRQLDLNLERLDERVRHGSRCRKSVAEACAIGNAQPASEQAGAAAGAAPAEPPVDSGSPMSWVTSITAVLCSRPRRFSSWMIWELQVIRKWCTIRLTKNFFRLRIQQRMRDLKKAP